YVTNEASGDLTVIDARSQSVVGTIPLGKRPRGVQLDVARRRLFAAVSGSPFAGPEAPRGSLPPPDRRADGIAVVDLAQNKLLRILPAGDDPEQFALTRDGERLYVSNEDTAQASIVDVSSGRVVRSLAVGGEPEGVALRPDGKIVYVTSEDEGRVFVIDTAAQTVLKSFEVGPHSGVSAMQSDLPPDCLAPRHGVATARLEALR